MANNAAGDTDDDTAAPSVFDLKPPRPREDLGLTDRQITDVAWEQHVAEKFGGAATPEDSGSYDSE